MQLVLRRCKALLQGIPLLAAGIQILLQPVALTGQRRFRLAQTRDFIAQLGGLCGNRIMALAEFGQVGRTRPELLPDLFQLPGEVIALRGCGVQRRGLVDQRAICLRQPGVEAVTLVSKLLQLALPLRALLLRGLQAALQIVAFGRQRAGALLCIVQTALQRRGTSS